MIPRAEQAIYTSLSRDGRAGYHVVARSPGITDADARALAAWSPSHGALLVDAANRASVNLHPLPGGRLALSRSVEGRPEYSGRGGRQVYTRAIVLDAEGLARAGGDPFAIYRDAMALGHLLYDPAPPPVLAPVALGRCHAPADPEALAARLAPPGPGPAELAEARRRLAAGETVRLRCPGDRLLLAECLLAALPPDLVAALSVSTSLVPSTARPYRLALVG
jgi:hypothetical protein